MCADWNSWVTCRHLPGNTNKQHNLSRRTSCLIFHLLALSGGGGVGAWAGIPSHHPSHASVCHACLLPAIHATPPASPTCPSLPHLPPFYLREQKKTPRHTHSTCTCLIHVACSAQPNGDGEQAFALPNLEPSPPQLPSFPALSNLIFPGLYSIPAGWLVGLNLPFSPSAPSGARLCCTLECLGGLTLQLPSISIFVFLCFALWRDIARPCLLPRP